MSYVQCRGNVREYILPIPYLSLAAIFLYLHTLFTDDFFASTSPFPCTQVQKHADHCARHCVKMEKQLEGEWLVAARGVLVIESPCCPCHLTHCCRHPIALRSTLQPRRHLTVACNIPVFPVLLCLTPTSAARPAEAKNGWREARAGAGGP